MRMTIILKATHDCNLNCPFCYNKQNKDKDSSIMPVDTCLKILDKAFSELSKKYSEFTVIWHGGEPLLLGSKYFETVCGTFSDKYNVEWHVQTNGSLMNDAYGEVFRKYKIKMGCSWDGMDQDDRHSWKYLMNALNYYPTGAIFVVTKENMENVIPCFSFAVNQGVPVEFNLVFDQNYSEDDYTKMGIYMAQLFDYICGLDDCPICDPFYDYFMHLQGRPVYSCDKRFCVNNYVGIQPNGDVTHCGKPWADNFIYGKALDENFHFNELNKYKPHIQLTEDSKKQWDHCKDCKWLLCCNNGCISNCYDKDGNFAFNKGACAYYRTLYYNMGEILKYRMENNTLENRSIIDFIQNSNNLEFAKWRNYRCPTI